MQYGINKEGRSDSHPKMLMRFMLKERIAMQGLDTPQIELIFSC